MSSVLHTSRSAQIAQDDRGGAALPVAHTDPPQNEGSTFFDAPIVAHRTRHRVSFPLAAAGVALFGTIVGVGSARVVERYAVLRSGVPTSETNHTSTTSRETPKTGVAPFAFAPAGASDVAAATTMARETRIATGGAPAATFLPQAPAVQLADVLRQRGMDASIGRDFLPQPVVLDGGVSVEVVGDRATVTGEATSARSLIEEICRQAGIALQAYTAPDRRYVGHLENVLLVEAFRSILLSESYSLGVRSKEHPDHGRIVWLNVLGARADGPGDAAPLPAPSTPVTTPATPTQRFLLPSALLFEAFGTMDPYRRKEGQREILKTLSEPEKRARFLAMDAGEIADVVSRYQHSAEALRRLRDRTDRPEMQAKLDQVLSLVSSDEQGHDVD